MRTARLLGALLLAVFPAAFPVPCHAAGMQAAAPPPPAPKADPAAEVEKAREKFVRSGNDDTARHDLAGALAALGERLLDGQRYEEAEKRLSEAVDLSPQEPWFRFLRGNALFLLRRYDEAIQEVEKARGVRPADPNVLHLLGLAKHKAGETAEAVELWTEALRLSSDPVVTVKLRELLEKGKKEAASEEKMGRSASGMFFLSFDSAIRPELADAVLAELEDAYNRVGSDFGRYPSTKVQVILYTEKDFRTVTGTPSWTGAIYDGKIRIPLHGLSAINDQVRAVLYHEYTHVLVHDITRGNCPVWLNEGLAEVQERKIVDRPLKELPRRAREGTLLPLSRIASSFSSLEGSDVRLAYEQSHSFVSSLISTYGFHTLTAVLQELGEGASVSAAFSRAAGVEGADLAATYADWMARAQKD